MRLATPEGQDTKHPSRRLVAASIFTAGYAAAVSPANAQAVTTPTDGLVTMDVSFEGHEGYRLPGYLARPQSGGAKPVIIVVNEIFGIHAYIKDVCHRFAREGYVALAPDYFDRAGDPSTLSDYAQIRPIVQAARNAQVMGDTAGALNWLKTQVYADADHAGVTGFCWGGAVTWMAVANLPFRAGVAWYGRLTRPPENAFIYEEGREWPADVAGRLNGPVLGLYAENDQGIPLDSVEAMRAALEASGNPSHSQIIVYPGTEHGFHADYRPSYNEAAARDGWTRALRWFRQHGV